MYTGKGGQWGVCVEFIQSRDDHRQQQGGDNHWERGRGPDHRVWCQEQSSHWFSQGNVSDMNWSGDYCKVIGSLDVGDSLRMHYWYWRIPWRMCHSHCKYWMQVFKWTNVLSNCVRKIRIYFYFFFVIDLCKTILSYFCSEMF